MLLPLIFHHYPPFSVLLLFLIFSLPPCTVQSRTTPALSLISPSTSVASPPVDDDHHTQYDHATWLHHKSDKLVHAPVQDGSNSGTSQMSQISDIKRFLHRFGYLQIDEKNITNTFDSHLKHAIIRYQIRHKLSVTGSLNPETLSLFTSPRCGVPDTPIINPPKRYTTTKHYIYFPGIPRWNTQHGIQLKLTYAFSQQNMIKYLTSDEIRDAFRRAFAKWESTIPVTFVESQHEDYDDADIKIGFYRGDHGDGEPFDGVLGVLAHSFSPEDGRLHLDGDETWSVNFDVEKSEVAIDLESVVLHEIGHVLGLGHSFDKDAVMFPSLKPRTTKLDLRIDDIKGVQALYGSNPNFTLGSLLEAETSSSYTCMKSRLFVYVICCTISCLVLCVSSFST